MPEHVHLMIRPDVERISVTAFLQSLKRPIARCVLDRWRQLNAPILRRVTDDRGRSHFWQAGGGYDRNIYSPDEFEEKLHYIHHNPVLRDLACNAVQWRWSSVAWYEGLPYDGPRMTRIEM